MELERTDFEFAELFRQFVQEVQQDEALTLPAHTRSLAVLSALVGCGGLDAFRAVLPRALEEGFSPVAVKELVYQAAAYLGLGRMLPFLQALNEVLEKRGEALPQPPRGTTTRETRLAAGAEAQVQIFGEQMRTAWQNGPVNRLLAANCFGDYYTRAGLSLAEREIVTFCLLMAQGGCEPQLTAHAKGNFNMGNDRERMLRVILQCLPYLGYPRVLNAIACLDKAVEA